ncbi:hybrid sensor histidine kinase/response regulator [Ochrovirga pacifica]|uniref:hybrid sensor histidine kinase/response regulator n=1 Tax=Ochrovirga pacifica TaxID=1042376 RepID=UPI0002559DCA|nr:ATP-binding protein [Ochrovirga pacifica]
MQRRKHSITIKVVLGYLTLGLLASVAGIAIFSEIKTFTSLQKQDLGEQSKVVEIGSLIADIYENESFSRVAIQSKLWDDFKTYEEENQQLLLKIDSIKNTVDDSFEALILDSIQLVLSDKGESVKSLRSIQRNDPSKASIQLAIQKLSAIDSIFGKIWASDFSKDLQTLDQEPQQNIEGYLQMLEKYKPKGSIDAKEQKKLDSLLTVSKSKLKDAQKAIEKQRLSSLVKERELIENDRVISRKLREFLNLLETSILQHSYRINSQRQDAIQHSKDIIVVSVAIGFGIIVVFSLIFLNDFWKNQRYRKQLEEANKTTSSLLKSREQIISMVSHDLRTPLNTIKGYSELLNQPNNYNKIAYYNTHIQSAATYMGQLVNDLLEFSRVEKNNISINSVPFDLKKLIEEIQKDTERLLLNKPVSIQTSIHISLSNFIVSDPFRVKQILYNLVINATKFTEQGSIGIHCYLKQEKNLCIAVKDTGIGIAQEEQEQVFSAFSQVDVDTEIKNQGFGLGLTISKRIAELLGGTITLESELGKGSTFTLIIPVTFSKKVENASTPKAIPFYHKKIVVVEDDPSMRLLLKEMLSSYGIEVRLFEDGKKALKKLTDLEYDLLLTDIQLPKMNGIRLMELVKQHKNYKNQPIVAMTGRTNFSKSDYQEIGFDEVLVKPFGVAVLETLLQRFFKGAIETENASGKDEHSSQKKDFNLESIKAFLGDNKAALQSTLMLFLEDTQKNKQELLTAYNEKNLETLRTVGHKMLSMFRQLEAVHVVPYLEVLETIENLNSIDFQEFVKELDHFINQFSKYLAKSV